MITIIANFRVKDGGEKEFIRHAAVCARETRKENGNLSYRVFRARNDPEKFTFIEEWLNDLAIEKHNEMPHFKLFLDRIAPITAGAPDIEQITNVPEIRNV